MTKLISILIFCFSFSHQSFSQNISVEWSKCLGGKKKDEGKCIQPTKDGGFILIGSTSSNDGDIISGNHGGTDVWVVKLNVRGSIEWQKCYGGTRLDAGIYIEQTKDNGYIFVANSWSNDNNVKGNHVNHYLEKYRTFPDIWLVKLSEKGILQWQKCLGGINYDQGITVHQTLDEGYILLGSTQSIDGDVKGQHDVRFNADKEGYDRWPDVWVVKLTENGNIQWSKCLGSPKGDGSASIKQTIDNGYITILNDTLLIKLSKNGNTEWGKTLENRNGNEFQQTPDSGYLIIGTYLDGGLNPHISLTKLLENGKSQWEKRLGGSGSEINGSMQLTEDGGCIIIGTTTSDDGDISGHHEPIGYNNGRWNTDIWVAELSNTGLVKWQKCFGGTDEDNGAFINKVRNGEFILVGNTLSNNNDIRGYHSPNTDRDYDIWIAKIRIK